MADVTLWPPNHGECRKCLKFRSHVRIVQHKHKMDTMCYPCWFDFHLDIQDIDTDGIKLVRAIWMQDTSFNYSVPQKIEPRKTFN